MQGKHYQQEGFVQQQFDERILTTQYTKQQLQKDIDFESKRVNVDSSKKLAVMQRMDYDGFRQMVLGANLKPMKSGQIPNMYSHMPDQGNINPIATFNNIAHNEEEIRGFNEEVVKLTLQLQEHETLKPPENVGQFEKFFCKKCKDPMQRYTYMRLIDFSHYVAIIVAEFDAEMFLAVVDTF